MDLMKELLTCLSRMDYEAWDEEYVNALLENRDGEPFDSEWCRVYAEIEALKNDDNYTVEMEKEQEKIREQAFRILEQNRDSELSDYISDDFGLIYDSLVLNYNDAWLSKLIEEYKNKRIPAREFGGKKNGLLCN